MLVAMQLGKHDSFFFFFFLGGGGLGRKNMQMLDVMDAENKC